MNIPSLSSEPFSEQNLAKAVKAAQTQDSSQEARTLVLRAAETDRMFCAMLVCGFYNLDPIRHRPFARFTQRISQTPYAFGLGEDPRGTGKTTISTITGAIQPIIARPMPGTPWNGANTCFIFASKKKSRSAKFMSAVMEQWERNKMLHWLRPEIRPDRERRWSIEHGASLIRPNSSADLTYNIVGVDTGQAGEHCHIYLGDDFIDEANYYSPTEIQRAIEFIRRSSGVVDSYRGSRIIVQNQWTLFDVNHFLKDETEHGYEGKMEIFSRSMTACRGCVEGRRRKPNGRPEEHAHTGEVFPLFRWWVGDESRAPITMETLAEMRRKWGNQNYSAQLENNPLDPSLLRLKEDWLRPFDTEYDEYGMPAAVKFLPEQAEEPVRAEIAELYRVIMYDPGHEPEADKATRTACIVAGFHQATGSFIALDNWAEVMDPIEAIMRMLHTYILWWPQRVGVEKIGYQRVAAKLLVRFAREHYGITTLSTGNEGDNEANVWLMGTSRNKDMEIEQALNPLARDGRMYVTYANEQLREEWRRFPMWKFKDLLDCWRYVPRLVTRYRRDEKEQARFRQRARIRAFQQRFRSGADPVTGY